ncbi:MAG: DUF5752 family protein [Nitrospirales bacterium]
MTEHKARTPFYFAGCLELREMLGRKAADVQQLMTIIEEAPLDAIYYHTHSYFLREEHIPTLFPNDFATWAAISVRDRVLGERLGLLDPFAFRDLEALRTELVSTIESHLQSLWNVPRLIHGEPFEFIRSHIIEIDLELTAGTLKEFREHLATVDRSALFNHICEARIRKGRQSGDFVAWIESSTGLGLPELAAQVAAIQPLGLTLEGIRGRILAVVDAWLAHT